MANTLADLANAQLAQRRAQMTHEPYMPYQPAIEARQGIGRWAQGVSERSTPQGMLSALASEAQRYQQMPPEELAGNIGPSGGSGFVGMMSRTNPNSIPQLISDMAEARRIYEAQRAARLAQPEQNTLANIAAGAGALGAGTGLGYYGTEYLLGDRQ